MIAKVRLVSGLTLLLFVTGHIFNSAAGVVSFEAMDLMSQFTTRPWRTWPGTVILVLAISVHISLSLSSLYRRQTLRMKSWEATQNILGLLIPLFLLSHVMGTRGLVEIFGMNSGYAFEMLFLWVFMPVFLISQPLLILLCWVHGCLGLHTWLRLKPGYRRFQNAVLGLAVIWPTLAISGYVAAGLRAQRMATDEAWLGEVLKATNYRPEMAEFGLTSINYMSIGYLIFLALFFAARQLRLSIAKRERPMLLHYHGGRVIEATPGATVLEILRLNKIPHASVCGGRGRCSTCRIRVGRGADWLIAPDEHELSVLARIAAPPAVRLACQVRPKVDLEIAPLLPATAVAADGFEQPGYLAGQEMEVAFVFIDLRGSTGLSEGRLPYDFVFVLNQFFAAIDQALQDTGGHYAQFNGDGLMAIYGLESGLHQGTMEALQGAQEMMRRIDQLNESLQAELPAPLEIGIGIHSGEAIVGSMGPPKHPIISAIGDNVNIAARLEGRCKEFGVPLIVSEITCQRAGVDFSGHALETVEVRGREGKIDIRLIEDPRAFDLLSAPLESVDG
jgi:adenylate cyclase